MPATNTEQHQPAATDQLAEQARVARDERVRIVAATRELENALSAASWQREQAWHQKVEETLITLQSALKVTRESADADGSLLSEVVTEAPRLEPRVKCMRSEYEDLERHVEALRIQLVDWTNDGAEDLVDDIRQRLSWLTTALKHAQAKETELLYEAFQVDIGQGD